MRRKKTYFQTPPGAPSPIVHAVQHRLTFSEVDALAIAWHGHYPKFFEIAHTELMRKIGLTYENYRKHDTGAPIVQIHADYFLPLELDELFTVKAELIWSDGARINVNYQIIKQDGRLAGTGYTVQMLFDVYTHAPCVAAPQFLEDIWNKWRNGDFDND